MKKSLLVIALFAVLLFASSGLNDSPFGVMPGDRAPVLSLAGEADSASACGSDGNYLLLSFWSSGDAPSRQMCNEYSKWIAANADRSQVRMLAVNFDENEVLFRQIVEADGMDPQAQFNVKGEVAGKIRSEFRLDHGFGTLLIDPDGIVVAANPDSQTLEKFLGSI